MLPYDASNWGKKWGKLGGNVGETLRSLHYLDGAGDGEAGSEALEVEGAEAVSHRSVPFGPVLLKPDLVVAFGAEIGHGGSDVVARLPTSELVDRGLIS